MFDFVNIPIDGLGIGQLIFLLGIYGYLLATSSNYMAEGADLLLSVAGPSWAQPIGSILIPILGVVPDSLMILMSGLGEGTQEEIQEQLKIGCGTLVGSTIMLLTVPTAIGIWMSRRQLGGHPLRALKKEKIREKEILNTATGEIEIKQIISSRPVLPKKLNMTTVGATALSTTPKGAKVMMLTSLTYLFMQIPAFIWGSTRDGGASHEHYFALSGCITAMIAFAGYLYWASNDIDALEVISEKYKRLEQAWTITNGLHNIQRIMTDIADPFLQSERLFDLFDVNNNGSIDFDEMKQGWKRIGYAFDDEQAEQSFNMLDRDGDGCISRNEFNNWLEDYLLPQYIAAQPIATVSASINETSQLDSTPLTISEDDNAGILSGFSQLPSVLQQQTVHRLISFLTNPNEKTLRLPLNKEERYSLHVWCAQQQPQTQNYILQTHADDCTPDLYPIDWQTDFNDNQSVGSSSQYTASVAGSQFTSVRGTVGRGNNNNLNHVLKRRRDIVIEKLDKRTVNHVQTLRPQLRPWVPSFPIWACVSTPMLELYRQEKKLHPHQDPWTSVFGQYASHANMISLEQLQELCRKFKLDLRPTTVKFLFYSHDTDRDRLLTSYQTRLLFESLVDMSNADEQTVRQLQQENVPQNAADYGSMRSNSVARLPRQGSIIVNDESRPLLVNTNARSAVYGDVETDLEQSDVKNDEDDDDNEEEEEEDDDDDDNGTAGLTKAQILRLAFMYIFFGTLSVTIFSDPMVNVISGLGTQLGIPAFYISFIVTPLASNASEVIAAMKFASKKTDVTLGLTLSSLYGAASMNNTVCLSVFMAIIYFRRLSWNNTPETIVVLIITYIVGIIGLKQTLPLWKAAVLLSLFPISILFIYILNLYW